MVNNKNKRTKVKPANNGDAAISSGKPLSTQSNSSSFVTSDDNAKKGLWLTSGQMTILIFLCMGISRLLQFGSAIRVEPEEDADNQVVQASRTCLHFLNATGNGEDWTPESTCVEDGFNTLLRYKYALGWQVTAMVTALMLQLWTVEPWLKLWNVALLMTPVLVGMASLFVAEPVLVSRERVWSQVIMAMVLSALGRPANAQAIPFLGGPNSHRRNYTKSLQSLVMLSLACLFFFQATLQWGVPLIPKLLEFRSLWIAPPDSVVAMAAKDVLSFINTDIITTATKSPSSAAIVLFMLVDKLTLALVYFFAWFYLPEQEQRTLLLYTGVVFFGSATYLWPWLGDQIAHSSSLQMIDWTVAGFGFLTWITPTVAFGWNSNRSATTTAATTSNTNKPHQS